MGNAVKKMYDLSFAGSYIQIGGARVNEFMDDQNPIEIQDAEVSNIEWSCNGRMIRTIKPSAVIISVTVIPGSSSDLALRKIWLSSFSNGGDVELGEANKGLTATIHSGHGTIPSYSFKNGTCLSGSPGLVANGMGKMGGNTYTFAFELVV